MKRCSLKDLVILESVLGGSGGGASDGKAKVSANDTLSNYLENKLVSGTGITLTVLNEGGNETIEITSTGGGTEFTDDTFRVIDDIDNTKKLALEVANLTTGTTRTVSVPDKDGIMALLSDLVNVKNDLGIIYVSDNLRLCLYNDVVCVETLDDGVWTRRNLFGHHINAPTFELSGGFGGINQTVETADWETFQENYNLVRVGVQDDTQTYGDSRKRTILMGYKDSYSDIFVAKFEDDQQVQIGAVTNAIDLPSPYQIGDEEPRLKNKYTHDIPIEPTSFLNADEIGFNWYQVGWYDNRTGGAQNNGSGYCYDVSKPIAGEVGIGAGETYGNVGFESYTDFDFSILQGRCIESNKVYYSLEEYFHANGNGGTTPQGALEATIVGGVPTISWNREFTMVRDKLYMLRLVTDTTYTLGSDGTFPQIEAIVKPMRNLTLVNSQDWNQNGFTPEQVVNTTMSKDDGIRTFTITPTSAEFFFYEQGTLYSIVGADSVIWEDLEGEHWFYYEDGVLISEHEPTSSKKENIILNNAFVATIYWNFDDKKVEIDILEERHGVSMSPQSHLYNHITRGAQYVGGLAIGDILFDQTGNLDTHAQFSVTSGTYFDEDITHIIPTSAVGNTIPVLYNIGSAIKARSSEQANFAVLNAPSGRLYYNQNNGGTWQLTEVSNNDFVLYHIFAINGVSTGLLSVMGQNTYSTVSSARAGATEEIGSITSLLAFAEFIPIGTIIYQTSDGYSNAVKARIRSTDEGDSYVDWRTSEFARGSTPATHSNLAGLELAGSGVTWGHINDQSQSIIGAKDLQDSSTISSVADSTKKVSFDVSGITTGNTRAITIQDQNGTMALLSDIVSTFTGLSDTPSSYSGQAGNLIGVNSGETALEFKSPTGISSYETSWINRSDWTNVHIGSNTTKNADSNVTHDLNISCLCDANISLIISPTGAESDSFEIKWSGSSTSSYGLTPYWIDSNNIKLQSGASGLLYVNDSGAIPAIDSEDWYYKIKIYKLG